MATDFSSTFERLEHLLAQEEKPSTIDSRLELDAHLVQRKQCEQLLTSLDEHLRRLQSRFWRLSPLPPLEQILWAEAILPFPNLAFVVLETTGIHHMADILRLVVTDGQGTILFDQIVQPQRDHNQPNTRYTGLTQQDLANAPSLAEVWQAFSQVLTGRYVVAYNLSFVREHLNENAAHYGLPSIFLIGDCLQERAITYYHASYSLKLIDVLARIGYPMPSPAPAPQRAQGQLALLQAMSKGIAIVHASTPESDQEEEPPF